MFNHASRIASTDTNPSQFTLAFTEADDDSDEDSGGWTIAMSTGGGAVDENQPPISGMERNNENHARRPDSGRNPLIKEDGTNDSRLISMEFIEGSIEVIRINSVKYNTKLVEIVSSIIDNQNQRRAESDLEVATGEELPF